MPNILSISHAACKGHAPENTLAGIRAALALGVDGIEIDVHASLDGVPVLMHDETVDRTTNGAGRVPDLPLAALRELDAGSGVFEDRFAGEPIPTLAEVLDLTRDRCLLVIEVKQRQIERQVAAVVRQAGAAAGVMIWSFHEEVVAAARSLLPEVPVARLWGGVQGTRAEVFASTVRHGAQAVSVHFSAVTPELVRAARLCGLSVFTWTVDEPADQARVASLGVAGICTNLPDVLAVTLEAKPAGTFVR